MTNVVYIALSIVPKVGVAGLMVWEEYSMATSKLKKAKERKKHTPILLILMYRLHVP
jgi:hypothetical protein